MPLYISCVYINFMYFGTCAAWQARPSPHCPPNPNHALTLAGPGVRRGCLRWRRRRSPACAPR